MKAGQFNRNRNGYDWHTFLDAFKRYITKEEVEEVETELEIRTKVEEVEEVDPTRKCREPGDEQSLEPAKHSRLPSTGSTSCTEKSVTSVTPVTDYHMTEKLRGLITDDMPIEEYQKKREPAPEICTGR
jgi:ribonucleotide reductase alpha subunit